MWKFEVCTNLTENFVLKKLDDKMACFFRESEFVFVLFT